MRKKCYEIFIPAMLINDNVYTFLSGIFISLSTNIFTSLCIEGMDFKNKWYIIVAIVMFLVAGAVCIYFATKLRGIQEHIKQIILDDKIKEKSERRERVKNLTTLKSKVWFWSYVILILSILLSLVFLILHLVLIKFN